MTAAVLAAHSGDGSGYKTKLLVLVRAVWCVVGQERVLNAHTYTQNPNQLCSLFVNVHLFFC